MGKSKKTITDIQKALYSNTSFIKDNLLEPLVIETPPPPLPDPDKGQVTIDPSIFKRIKILAAYEKVPSEDLINLALNHYLRLKSAQIEAAMHKLTEE